MVDFFVDNFSNCVPVAVLLMAMLPMIESKIAIPFALSSSIWGEATMSPVGAFFTAFVGSVLPAFLVICIVRFIKKRTTGFVHEKFMSKLENRYENKLQKVEKKSGVLKKCLALSTFVAIPLPLTGVYTGGIIAGLLDVKVWQAFLAILVGEIFSCGIVLAVCLIFDNSAFYIFVISLILVAVWIVVSALFYFIKKHKRKI